MLNIGGERSAQKFNVRSRAPQIWMFVLLADGKLFYASPKLFSLSSPDIIDLLFGAVISGMFNPFHVLRINDAVVWATNPWRLVRRSA